MKQLATYGIPNRIRSIEFDNNTENLEYYKSVVQRIRLEECAYIEAFTAMIQLEETANSKRLAQYDLYNVKLDMYSDTDQIFQIQYDVSIADYLT